MECCRFFRSGYSKFAATASKAKDYIVNHREEINTALQWYNFAVATLVTVDYVRHIGTDDEKNPVEYGSDIAVHLLQWSLSYSSGLTTKLAALAANGYRTVDIPLRILLNTATVPGPIAVVDSFNHFINTMGTMATLQEDAPETPKCA